MKKLLSIILAVCLVLSVVVFANAENIPDTTVHQALTSMIEEPPTVYQFGRFMYYFDFSQYILCGYDIDNSNVSGVINPDADNAYEEAYEGEIVIPDKLHIRDVSSYPPDEVVESGPNMPADGYISFGKIDRSFYSSIKNSLKKLTLPSTLTDFAIHYVPNTVECIAVNDNHPNLSVENNILFNKDKTQIVFFPRIFSGEYTIPNTVTSIGKYCFMNCSELTKVTVPQGVETIDSCAFLGCTKLTDIALPEGLTAIGNHAFKNCSAIAKIDLPTSLKSISNYAFDGCTKLTDITLPQGLTILSSSVFINCESLEKINIPDSVIDVGSSLFTNTAFYNDLDNWENGSLYHDGVLLESNKSVTSFTVKPGTRVIASNAFNNPNLTSISLPEGIESLSGYAIVNGQSLTEINIPSTLWYVGMAALRYCTKLDITLPDTIEWLGDSCLPEKYYSTSNADSDGFIYNGNHLLSTKSNTLSGVVKIRPGTKTIHYNALSYQKELTEVILPEGVTYIGSMCFRNNYDLKYVYFPASVKYIGDDIFNHILFSTLSVTVIVKKESYAHNVLVNYPGVIRAVIFSDIDDNFVRIDQIENYESHFEYKSLQIPPKIANKPVCEISEDAIDTPNTINKIIGYVGSPCKSFAEKHNIPFEKMYYYGDLSGDFEIKAEDALLVLHASVEKIALNQDESILADVDGDGDTTASDALAILQMAVGKIKEF